jgi:uncharacterized protein YfdQ (DUF2303 family)
MQVDPKLTDVALGEVLGLGAALSSQTLNVEAEAHPLIALPQGWAVHDLEKYLSAPARAKGQPAFADVESFIRYVNKHKDVVSPSGPATEADQLQTVIFADVLASKFLAVFNHHGADQPGWRDHKASYDCPLSKEWQTWNAANGKKWDDQEEFAFFIEQNILDIHEPVGADMLRIITTLKATKNVSFDSGIRLDNGQTQIKYHEEVTGKAGGAGEFTIPDKIKLGIPVYVGATAYEVWANFRYRLLNGGRMVMWYDLVRPHKILEDAFTKVVEQIATGTEIQPFKVATFSGAAGS